MIQMELEQSTANNNELKEDKVEAPVTEFIQVQRACLLEKIQGVLPPESILPPNRLEYLLK